MPKTGRSWLRVILALLAGGLLYLVAYLLAWFGWFWVTGANFKIGPSDLFVPEWVFYLVNLAFASAATVLVALPIVTGRLHGYRIVLASAFVAGGTWFLVMALVTGDPEENLLVFYGALAMASATAVGASMWAAERPAQPA